MTQRKPSPSLCRRTRSSASWVVSMSTCDTPQLSSRRLRRCDRRASELITITRAASAPVACWRSPMTLSSGISNQNVEPRPGSDSTPMRPPIRSMMRLQIARPKPVPPYSRVVEASACAKERNRRACWSGAMPIPVSRTWKRSRCWARVSPRRRSWMSTLPRSVNLMALPIRLPSTWRRRIGSPRTSSRTDGSISRLRRSWRPSAVRCSNWMTPSSSSRRLKVVISSSSLLASSLE